MEHGMRQASHAASLLSWTEAAEKERLFPCKLVSLLDTMLVTAAGKARERGSVVIVTTVTMIFRLVYMMRGEVDDMATGDLTF